MIVTCPRTIYICIFNMITIAAQPNPRIFRYYLHFFQQTTNPVPSFAPTESDHGALWYSPPMDLDTFLTGGQADKTTNEVRLPLFLVYIYKNNFFLVSHLKCFSLQETTTNHFKRLDLSGILQRYAVCCTVVTLPCHRTQKWPSCQLNGF